MNIDIPNLNDFYKWKLIDKKDFPCHCKIGKRFELDFTGVLLQEIRGDVPEFDIRKIDKLSAPYAGGEYSHNSLALVHIQEKEHNYHIKELSLFSPHEGWLPIITNFTYVSKPIS